MQAFVEGTAVDPDLACPNLVSNSTRRLALFGAGGVGLESLQLAERLASERGYGAIIFLDDFRDEPVLGTPVLRPADLREEDLVCLTIGSPAARQALAERCKGRSFANLVAGTSLISPAASLGEGAVIFDFVMINPRAQVGRHFLSLYYSHVSHDCVVGDYVTFGSHVACNGHVHIGDKAFIGSGAVLKNGSHDRPLRIGARAVVGMGAVVIEDVPDDAIVAGNPARPIARRYAPKVVGLSTAFLGANARGTAGELDEIGAAPARRPVHPGGPGR